MLGAYVTVTLMNSFGWPFLATLPLAFVVAGIVSVGFEQTLFRPLYRASDLDQVLLTIGLVFMAVAAVSYVFGTESQPIHIPDYLRGFFTVGTASFAVYRIFLVVVALLVSVLLIVGLEYTRFGAQIRAAVDNQRMARGLGIDVNRIFAYAFALGSGLAGLGGALAIEVVGLDHSFALIYLIAMLIIVSVGGLGSISGSCVAAILCGIRDTAGKYYFPCGGAFLIYLVMIAVLLWRPAGLFGKR
jgi:branched-chain amino acid transport system permease protein